MIVKEGYVARKQCGHGLHGRRYRNWWLVKATNYNTGILRLKTVYFPAQYVGKKIRLKIEIMPEDSK